MRMTWRQRWWLLPLGAALVGGFLLQPFRTPKDASAPPDNTTPTEAAPTVVAQRPAEPELLIPKEITPPEQLTIDPNDPAFRALQKQFGHNTGSLLNDAKPAVPIILASQTTERDAPKKPNVMPPELPMLADAFDPKPAPTVRCFNSRDIQLAFEVTKAGTSGIKFVEVWAKNVRHKEWCKLERYPASAGPLTATLPSEGQFALSLVLESSAGKRTPLPIDGDLLVEVDLTPPHVELLPLQASPEGGKVTLEWLTTERNYDPQATTLEYSTDGRTWQAIGGFDPKTLLTQASTETMKQRFVWSLPTDVTDQVQWRVTVGDKVGHRTTATAPRRASVDVVVPQGRITEVRPARGVPELGPPPRLVR